MASGKRGPPLRPFPRVTSLVLSSVRRGMMLEMEGGGGGDTGPPRLDMGAGGLCFWGCNPGLPKKKKKKKAEEMLMRAGWKGGAEKYRRRVNLLLRAALVWPGPTQILSRFWVGRIWVCSQRLSPATLLWQ